MADSWNCRGLVYLPGRGRLWLMCGVGGLVIDFGMCCLIRSSKRWDVRPTYRLSILHLFLQPSVPTVTFVERSVWMENLNFEDLVMTLSSKLITFTSGATAGQQRHSGLSRDLYWPVLPHSYQQKSLDFLKLINILINYVNCSVPTKKWKYRHGQYCSNKQHGSENNKKLKL